MDTIKNNSTYMSVMVIVLKGIVITFATITIDNWVSLLFMPLTIFNKSTIENVEQWKTIVSFGIVVLTFITVAIKLFLIIKNKNR